jgi:hypothetical protein
MVTTPPQHDPQLAGSGEQPLPLSYADPAAQLGIVIQRDGSGLRVIVPRPRGLRMLLTGHWVVFLVFGTRVVAAWDDGKLEVFSAMICVVAFGHMVYTIWRRRVFLVSGSEVRFGYLRPGGDIWEEAWPRESIGEIKMNPYSGKLLIRVTGKDMREYFVSSNRMVTQRVADVLSSELGRPAATPVAAEVSVSVSARQ